MALLDTRLTDGKTRDLSVIHWPLYFDLLVTWSPPNT